MQNRLRLMNGKSDLRHVFVETAKEVLSRYPALKHEWSTEAENGCCTLEFPRSDENEFDITVRITSQEIIVYAEGAHQHFEAKDDDKGAVEDSLGLVRDLLSLDMRIRELRAGDSPYRWHIEAFRGGTWYVEHTTGLLFWNFFGRKTERLLQNNALPRRLNSSDSKP